MRDRIHNGWLQTNHPFWLMQLGGAACHSPRVWMSCWVSAWQVSASNRHRQKWRIPVLEGPSASEVGKEIAEHRERRVAIVEAVPAVVAQPSPREGPAHRVHVLQRTTHQETSAEKDGR